LYQWNLLLCTDGIFSLLRESFKLEGMRLPQSNPRSLSFRPTLGAISLALFFGLISTSAVAGTPQLTTNLTRLRFGTIVVGQSEALPVTLTNTGSTSVTISAINASNPEFSVADSGLPLVLPAGQDVNFMVTFTPTVIGWTGGAISFVSNASNKTVYVSVGAIGVGSDSLTPNPSTLAFGNVSVGSNSTLPVVVTNSGTTTIMLAQAQGTGTGFTLNGLSLPVYLAPKHSLTFNVTFAPQSTGAASGSVVLPNGGVIIPLTGTGTGAGAGQLALTPTSLNFGNVTVGTPTTQQISVGATGAPVTISAAASSNSIFVLNGASFPLTIAAGQNVSLNIAFTPKSQGTASGSLSFASNASNPQATESLTGIGILPQYTVNLSWNPSTSVVAGYNVYRGTTLGAYSRINPTLDSGTAYADGTVVSGHTYYYAATAVDSSGVESVYSTPIVATIP